MSLVASTRRIEPSSALDLVGAVAGRGIFFDDGELQMAAIGEAARLTGSLDQMAAGPGGGARPSVPSLARHWLRSIDVDDAVGLRGSGVLAFGAFPFDRSGPTTLVVPELLVVRTSSGDTWATTVHSAGARWRDPLAVIEQARMQPVRAQERLPEREAECPLGQPVVTMATTDDDYADLVRRAVAAVDAGVVAKVVVTRQADAVLPGPVDEAALIRRWRELEPGCAVFAFPSGPGRFVGATPELLVSRQGTTVECRPLAGTSAGRGSSLLSSEKDGAEHRFVVDAIGAALRPWCDHIAIPDHPRLVALRSISHLGTDIVATLRDTDGSPDALSLAALLHPTPAVGGVPTAAALELISRLEPHPRGQYGGPVGWVDGDGNGAWWYGIRSAVFERERARLTAGVGIVARSDPRHELEETRLKLDSVITALFPPSEIRPGDSAA